VSECVCVCVCVCAVATATDCAKSSNVPRCRDVPCSCRKNERGETPLHKAAFKGNVTNIQELVKRGADLEACVEQLSALGEVGCSRARSRDGKGKTAVILATIGSFKDAVAELVKAGANVEAKDADGRTAMFWVSDLLVGSESCVRRSSLTHDEIDTANSAWVWRRPVLKEQQRRDGHRLCQERSVAPCHGR
jgi:ankyrin repeat protein